MSLLGKMHGRDARAWDEFARIYESAIHAYCLSRGLQDADANDITQEVMRAVDGRLAESWTRRSATDVGSFRAWLFRVARNMCVDRFRALARRETATGDSLVAKRLAETPDEHVESEALESEYRRALLHRAAELVRPRVQAKSWQAFWRTAVEGASAERVARELGMSIGALYTAKCRVLARIKDTVARLDATDASAACGSEVGASAEDGLRSAFEVHTRGGKR